MRYILGTLLAVMVAAGPVWADCAKCEGKSGQCPMSQCRAGGHDHGKDDLSKCPINSKTLEKAKFFLAHAEEIGLSEEQVQSIKAIKAEAKKAKIRQTAEMEIFHMDIMAKLSEPKLDVEGLNKMLDDAAAGMTAGGKASIATYAKLKAVLSEQQAAKAKDVWRKSSH
jgi:hypothetical protein